MTLKGIMIIRAINIDNALKKQSYFYRNLFFVISKSRWTYKKDYFAVGTGA